MNDRELLEMAAKAAMRAGVKLECPDDEDGIYVCRSHDRNGHTWNPRTDEGDALRLAVKIGWDECQPYIEGALAAARIDGSCEQEAVCLAITLAAAEIGKAM